MKKGKPTKKEVLDYMGIPNPDKKEKTYIDETRAEAMVIIKKLTEIRNAKMKMSTAFKKNILTEKEVQIIINICNAKTK